MYIKLVGNTSTNHSSGTNWKSLFDNIVSIATGGITSTSQLTSPIIVKETSLITGTPPTSGMYLSYLSSLGNSSTGAGSGGTVVALRKYHYAKGQNSGAFNPSSIMVFNYDNSTYGLKLHYMDGLGGNPYPNSGYAYPTTGGTGSTSVPLFSDLGYSHFLDSRMLGVIHIIITDHIFAIQIQSSGPDTSKDYYTLMINDLEYVPSIDNYAYTGNSRYTPQVFNYWVWLNCMDRGNGLAASGANQAAFGVYRQNYLDQFGTTYRNTLTSTYDRTDYHFHGAGSGINTAYLEPRCSSRIYQAAVSNGEFGHQLVPMQYVGHTDGLDNFGDPRRGRLMSFYRTSEDLGFTGEIITEGSGNFRLFRIHKCGSTAMTSATYNACYAIPEFNVPYGS